MKSRKTERVEKTRDIQHKAELGSVLQKLFYTDDDRLCSSVSIYAQLCWSEQTYRRSETCKGGSSSSHQAITAGTDEDLSGNTGPDCETGTKFNLSLEL